MLSTDEAEEDHNVFVEENENIEEEEEGEDLMGEDMFEYVFDIFPLF